MWRIFKSYTLNKVIAGVALAVFIAGLCLLHGATGSYAVYYNASGRRLPIYSVQTDKKQVAISFDCAWGTEKTDALLEHMEFYGVKCTFFMTQFWVEKNPDYVKKIHDAGHEIGTHSATHSYMSKMTEEEIVSELESSSKAIEDITGERVILFRPPYGDYDDKLIKTCEKGGFYPIQWDVDSLDWKDLSAAEISKRIISRAKEGSIILCHNNALNTADALPHIFADMQGRGYEFVKISDLIYKDNYTVDHTGRQWLNENS